MSDAREKKSISLEKFRENWQRQLVLHPDIPASVLKVALAIGWHLNRNKGGLAWPSVRTMSRLTSLSLSTVVWAVKWLEGQGYLDVQRRREGKRNLPNLYRPLVTKPVSQQNSQHSAQRGQRKAPVKQGVPIVIEQGVPIATSTEPSTEPLNEPHMQIRISAPTDVDALPGSDHEGNKGSGTRERKRADDSPTARPERLASPRAECYRLAGDYDGNRGRALVTKALEGGADQDVLDEIRVAIEAGDDLGYALSDFWKHSLG